LGARRRFALTKPRRFPHFNAFAAPASDLLRMSTSHARFLFDNGRYIVDKYIQISLQRSTAMTKDCFRRSRFFALGLLLVTGTLHAADYDAEPINYEKAAANNAIERLQQRLDAGKTKLKRDEKFGFLPALLKELNVPVSSQMLVFSKTSFQFRRINPQAPRAIYFNDDVYVGFCQKGPMLEVSVADPNLGTVFYSLQQTPTAKPKFARHNESCMICHGSSRNEGLPGHLVRSVYPDSEGFGILSSGSFRIDHTTPLKNRWGGWYVTGNTGKQTHLGNLVITDKSQRPEDVDNTPNINVTDLSSRFRTSSYLSGHSDVVALMVLEHQTAVHNRITRANFFTRVALHDEAAINQALNRPANTRSESTERRIRDAAETLVKDLLLSGEAPLTDMVSGTSNFAAEFSQRGPRDKKGRSLRDLDLKKRLFKYPCSYLIYSEAFDALPALVKDQTLRHLWDIVNGKDANKDFAHLSADDRQAIREILIDTKPNLPNYWRATTPK
jgi:hypothetical protein